MTESKSKDATAPLDPVALAASSATGDEADKNKVKITLSGHLDAQSAVSVGLENKAYLPETEVTVTKNNALAIINSGLGGIDPSDQMAVAKALG